MSHDISTASPFRKVSTGTWADKKVRDLSPILPSGQALFVMLMIGPQTTNIPGVQPVGRLGFAEMLDWEPEAFDKAFAEVFAQGLAKADWKARFVFVPKAIQHNLPQSPNVVKSWAATWAKVPDCDLKREAWETIYAALISLGDSFAKAFKAACPLDSEGIEGFAYDSKNDSPKATGKPSAKATDNQEQEKKQEQEKPLVGPAADPEAPGPDLQQPQGETPTGAKAPATTDGHQPSRRGTRLPADWQLPRAWGEWALAEFPGWTAETVRAEAEKFGDHWRAKAGRDAVKLDWPATWRNWCRNARPGPAPVAAGGDNRLSSAGRQTAEAVKRLMEGMPS